MIKPRDTTPYPRDPRSVPISAATEDGGYVFVQDGNGVVFVLPDAPHVHPLVLGGGQAAMYAGDLTLKDGKVIDLTNLSGTFPVDDENGLRGVAAQIRR